MDSYKLAVKFFIDAPSDLPIVDFTPVFHRWIQSRALAGHQLIDVADYAHVHQGPGIVLVSHEANIHADLGGGRPGLLYIRKAPLPGTFTDRLRAIFGYALKAAALLESDESLSGRVKIRTNEAALQINDRLAAPSTPETFEDVKAELSAFLGKIYGSGPVELTPSTDARSLFEVGIRAKDSVPVLTLLDRLATT